MDNTKAPEAASGDGWLPVTHELMHHLTASVLDARRTRDAAQIEATKQLLLARSLALKVVQVETDNGHLEAKLERVEAENVRLQRLNGELQLRLDEAMVALAKRAGEAVSR